MTHLSPGVRRERPAQPPTRRVSIRLFTLLAFIGAAVCSGQLKADEIEVLNTFDTNNVAVAGKVAYAAAGPQGIVIVDLNGTEMGGPEIAGVIAPPGNTGTVDDVSIDGGLLFTLDAAGTGGLSVFSIETPLEPTLVSGPVSVGVSPFAGVSAANGRVVVSGGTGLLSVRSYQANGTLANSASTIDLGVGQPDVLVAENGETAFVSTDFSGFFDGQTFGITVIDIAPGLSILDRIGIAGAGFSPGVDGPANFPIESAQAGDTLYVASGNGVAVLDVSNPNSVQTQALIPLNTNPVNIDVVGDTLYVVGNSPTPTMTTIDVSVLSSPVIQTTALPSGSRPLGVAATNTRVVIADSNLGILVESLLLPGDVNQDCDVNFFDIAPFIEILITMRFQAEADVDGNNTVDFFDIVPFIEILSGSST